MIRKYLSFPILLLIFFVSCQNNRTSEEKLILEKPDPLFKKLNPEETHISFVNQLEETLNLNVLMYEYLYNGGGVAVGDLNQDGFEDIYFSANVSGNQLYLNQGNLKFSEVSQEANAQGIMGPWNTGVVMADVNGDGLLDIYQCRSGALPAEKRKNLLLINTGNNENGVPVFEEKGAEFGIDSGAPSTSASFFDFDLDGDLDLFLLNHNTRSIQNLDVKLTQKLLEEKHEAGSQLFENRNGKFVEITQEAGISSSSFSYGLGVSTADINQDGYPDIFIGNDYSMPDYLYINQKNKTFKDEIGQRLGHTSHFSMGNDIADINNDALPDIFTLDMLPEDNERQKLLLAPDNFELFQLNLDKGWHHQYMRNMLHLNSGDGNFQEVGQLSGISNTDWSWSALFADFDNDGWKDLFVSNGYLRDYNNQDFLKYMDNYVKTSGGKLKREDLLKLVKSMSSTGLSNYVFRNGGNLRFENKSVDWGLDLPATSNGAAYADLDNDGDLDLIINNINDPAGIYENLSVQKQKGNFLRIVLKGKSKNPYALGTKLKLFASSQTQYLEQNPFRGYQSSVSPVLHIGLGEVAQVDSIIISWTGGEERILYEIPSNQTLELDETMGSFYQAKKSNNGASLAKYLYTLKRGEGVKVNDFKRQPMLLHPISGQGKALVIDDFNGDGLGDLFLGGNAGISGVLLFQKRDGGYSLPDSSAFQDARDYEDSDAISLDANSDGLPDLIIVGGGLHQFSQNQKAWTPRLYLNEGEGKFFLKEGTFTTFPSPVGKILAADFNQDGHQDIFLGVRVTTDQYPSSEGGQIWVGDGKGNYSNATRSIAPELIGIGMITDAIFQDLNQDGQEELLLVGEAMPITIFEFEGKEWRNSTDNYFDNPVTGLWNHINLADWDGDGKGEILAGNLGENSQLNANENQPAELLYKDFDNNGFMDAVLGYFIGGQKYPLVSRDELLGQIPMLKKRYLDFKSYSNLKFEDLFTPEERNGAKSIQINELKTLYLVQDHTGKFQKRELPQEVQFSPVFASLPLDLNQDGNLDMILGGNIGFGKLSLGRYDASRGLVLLGDGGGNFSPMTIKQSGISLDGDVRSIAKTGNKLLFQTKQHGLTVYQLLHLKTTLDN